MSSPEELLRPLKSVLDDLTSFAHERYCDAVKQGNPMSEGLRLVAAAEGFQTLAAVHQISRAINGLEQGLRDAEVRQALTLPPSPPAKGGEAEQ